MGREPEIRLTTKERNTLDEGCIDAAGIDFSWGLAMKAPGLQWGMKMSSQERSRWTDWTIRKSSVKVAGRGGIRPKYAEYFESADDNRAAAPNAPVPSHSGIMLVGRADHRQFKERQTRTNFDQNTIQRPDEILHGIDRSNLGRRKRRCVPDQG